MKNLAMLIILTGILSACQEDVTVPIVDSDSNTPLYLGEWKTDSLRDIIESNTSTDTISYSGAIGDGIIIGNNEITFTVFSESIIRSYQAISNDSLSVHYSDSEDYAVTIDSINESKLILTEIYDSSLNNVINTIHITHYLSKNE